MKLILENGYFSLVHKGITIPAKDFRIDSNRVFHGTNGCEVLLTVRQVKSLLKQLEGLLCQEK